MSSAHLNQRPTFAPSPTHRSNSARSPTQSWHRDMQANTKTLNIHSRRPFPWGVVMGLILIVTVTLLWWAGSGLRARASQRGIDVPASTASPTHDLDAFLNTSIGAFVAKLVACIVILLLSIVGVASPLWWARGKSIPKVKVSNSTGPTFISIGNCFSAGLLLGMGALHFLPEAIEAQHRRSETMNPAAEAESKFVFAALILGLCIPLIIDSVQHTFERWGMVDGDHAHSHGHTEAEEASPLVEGTTNEDGYGTSAFDGAVAYPSGNSTTASIAIPSNITSSVSSAQPARSPSLGVASGPPNAKKSSSSGVVILACLLTFHGLTEGFMLGLEPAGSIIISVLLPLGIHKYFDAFVLGLRMVGREESQMGGANEGICSQARRYFWALVAVLSTPISLMVIALFELFTSESDIAAPPNATSIIAAAVHHHHAPPTKAYIASQAIGAGSFLYIALGDILPLEFKGGSTPAYRWNQLMWVAVGIAFVHIQSLVFPHEH